MKNALFTKILITLMLLYSSAFTQTFKQSIDSLAGADTKLLHSINSNRTEFKNTLLKITDRSMMPVSLMFPVSLFIYGKSTKKNYDENSGYLMSSSMILNNILTISLKYSVKRERPYRVYHGVYYDSSSQYDRYSFPSGHTSNSFAAATMTALRYPNYPYVYIPIYLWGIIIGYGRSYWGMHYPSDVLTGAVIGTLSSIAVYSFRAELIKGKNKLFGEISNADEGSIKGGVLSLFAGTFIVSSIFDNIFVSKPYHISVSFIPENEFGIVRCNLRYRF